MSALAIAGMLLAVVALAAIAWALGLGGAPTLDRARAMAEAEDRLADFSARDAFVSDDGAGALVVGQGDFALLKAHGVGLAVRRLARIAPVALPDGVRIPSGERMFGAVTLKLPPRERDRLLALV